MEKEEVDLSLEGNILYVFVLLYPKGTEYAFLKKISPSHLASPSSLHSIFSLISLMFSPSSAFCHFFPLLSPLASLPPLSSGVYTHMHARMYVCMYVYMLISIEYPEN